MAVVEEELRFRTVGEIFSLYGDRLRIPNFQRPYRWGPRQVGDLVDDITDDFRRWESEETVERRESWAYVLGTLILHREGEESATAVLQVVDGQQRLLTLKMLCDMLEGEWMRPPGPADSAVSLAATALLERIPVEQERREELKSHLIQHCTLLAVITDDEDEAFQFFDSQNLRGKSLRPHDLLKAFHLREMAGSTDLRQASVVALWQSIDEVELDNLFSRVLYRIDQWSRGQSAPGFTTEEIDSFKGVSVLDDSPSARYHRAAQVSLPALDSWTDRDGSPASAAVVDRSRARFQLGAPVAAGETFFEFVAFQYDEMRRIDAELFGEGGFLDKKYGTHPRYVYCRDLLVCALLYYRNVFGERDGSRVREALARYAYSPRMAFQRVGWQTIDNYAVLGGTDRLAHVNPIKLFLAIRHARTERDVRIYDLVLAGLRDKEQNENDSKLYSMLLDGGGDSDVR